jgi:membrane peptidoglycan carboxypeptidase
MAISGVDTTLKTIHDLGATSYCKEDGTVGLASAIGGCGVEQVDLVNAYASLARGGVYKPQSSVLEVKNSSNETLKKWSDVAGKQIVSQQSAYIVSDILTDPNASAALGSYAAKSIPGVKTATKTGTSDKGGNAKDLWMMSYSPALTMGVWLGNPDTTILKNGTSSLGSPIVAKVMEFAHKEVYAKDNRWKSGDWFKQPNGIQRIGNEVYPSWWNKSQGQANAKLTFDKLSKKKATDCTPAGAKIELDVIKSIDPVTKKDIYSNVPDGYDAKADDDRHSCSDTDPSIASILVTPSGLNNWVIRASISQGTFSFDASGVTISVNGQSQVVSQVGGQYQASYSGANPTDYSMNSDVVAFAAETVAAALVVAVSEALREQTLGAVA